MGFAVVEPSVFLILCVPSPPVLYRACCSFVMFALSVAYYGVTLALGTLAGSLHLNFFLTAVAELPGTLHTGLDARCRAATSPARLTGPGVHPSSDCASRSHLTLPTYLSECPGGSRPD